jgi:amidophosphoribosyltransferase
MYGCKYLHFSPSTNDNELIARKIILELEGETGFEHIDEYSDGSTERGRALRETLSKKLNFASLDFQTLDGIIEAIGIDREKLCTYCWNGKG